MTKVGARVADDGAPQRRTQTERRALTRAALLDATIDSLVEHGYARFTTEQIVRRAGVTRGAQAHHFSTKAELIVEALRRVSEQILAKFSADPLPIRGDPNQLLQQIWQIHISEVYTATTELWVAARTEPELRAGLQTFVRQLMEWVYRTCAEVDPELAARPGFRTWLQLTLATVRGLAILRFVRDPDEVDLLWDDLRSELLSRTPGPRENLRRE